MPLRLVRLSRDISLDGAAVDLPVSGYVDLPEKVIQFGTGAFLRAFADAFIDQANRAGGFCGRVVAVESTGSGRSVALNDQDGLYTLCVRGLERGLPVECCSIISSVSRALDSREQWNEVLACARNPEIKLVVSNTTEAGIRLDEGDRMDFSPPRSFPGKLTAFLYERAKSFEFDPSRGVIVLCCELIDRNGERLLEIVRDLAERWELGGRFQDWLSSSNRFCNTLVDRIVPGSPDRPAEAMRRLGYRDDLIVEAEPYRLWAIEGDVALRRRLGFADSDPGIVVVPDIEPYRERKVRILNGTHTIMVPLSLLCGNETVCDTMRHPLTSRFVRRVMLEEIVPSIELDTGAAWEFARLVIERFENPFIHHKLRSILLQQTLKMGVRVLPTVRAYTGRHGIPPHAIAFGFAAYLLLLREGDDFPPDEGAATVRDMWPGAASPARQELAAFVDRVCAHGGVFPAGVNGGFPRAVAEYLDSMIRQGVVPALEEFLS
ncbi:MAG: tagaturonate reductase [Rhodothermales bacterium]